jgi:hypothetical protein
MDEAAPQAAAGTGVNVDEADTGALRSALGQQDGTLAPSEQEALEALRFGWGDAYLIGHDDDRGYWAARRDKIGGLLTASDPDELRNAIREDYAAKPVPREPRRRTDAQTPERALGTDPGELLTRSAEP